MGKASASQRLHVSETVGNLPTAMYLFGVGTGSVFAGPLSETCGRNPVYFIATFCYLCFVLGAALSSTFTSLIVSRFFTGAFSGATLTINGSSVSDLRSYPGTVSATGSG
jgi:MFS family permease